MTSCPLFGDAAVFSAAFLSLPPVLPWARLAHLPHPFLAATPPGFAEALFAPPPPPPTRGPLQPPPHQPTSQPAAAEEVVLEAVNAEPLPEATRTVSCDAVTQPAPAPRSELAAPRRYSRRQLCELRGAAPPPNEGVLAAAEELSAAAPSATALPPRERAAPPLPPPEAPLPPRLPLWCGLWGEAGPESAWSEPLFLADVAAVSPAIAALTAA